MNKLLFIAILLCCSAAHSKAQDTALATGQTAQSDTVVFRFAPGKLMFVDSYKGNASAINILTHLLRQNRTAIEAGYAKVRILGFCSSFATRKENLAAAKNRSNQVKSYFIVHERLKEEHFKTTNSTRRWHGMTDQIAVVYLSQPQKHQTDTVSEQPRNTVTQSIATPGEADTGRTLKHTPNTVQPSTGTVSGSDNKSDNGISANQEDVSAQERNNGAGMVNEQPSTAISPAEDNAAAIRPRHQWAIKTNIAYLAATVANLGVEFGFGQHYSVDLPLIYSPYTVSRSYRLSFLSIQPEFRYWLHKPMKGHFFGIHINIGTFNIAVDRDRRYQSPDGFYGVGLSYGYTLPMARRWAAEFTIGGGYVHTKYDTYYNIRNGARYEQDTPYNYWGLTKAGINLIYKFGK